MTDEYRYVPANLAHDPVKRGMSDAERVLADYLQLCRHATPAGCANSLGAYLMPLPYIAHDLRWTVRKVRSVMARLVERHFALYDHEMEWVFIPSITAALDPANQSHGISLQRRMEALPSSTSWYRTFVAAWNALAARVGKGLGPVALARPVDQAPTPSGHGADTVSAPSRHRADTVSTQEEGRKEKPKEQLNSLRRAGARDASPALAPVPTAPAPASTAPSKPRQAHLPLPINGGRAVEEEARQAAASSGTVAAREAGKEARRRNWLNNLLRFLSEHGSRAEVELCVLLMVKARHELTRAEQDQLNRWDGRMKATGWRAA